MELFPTLELGWLNGWIFLAFFYLIFGILIIILIIFTPLKIESLEFIIGVVIFSLGTIGFIVAILNFKNAPLDKPVTSGLYEISRNPQMIMLNLVGIGISIIIGSYIAMILLVITQFFSHFRILGEEKRLLEQYGDLYKDYMNKVPRYFLFF